MKKNKTNCGKKIYESEDLVLFIGREQLYFFNSQPLYYYYCELCYGWHLTSKETKNKIN